MVMKRSNISIIIAALLIVLFSYTAIAKLMDVEEFRRQLAGQELPDWAKGPLVWLIPAAEIFTSILLIFRATRLWGLLCSTVLMILFTVYVGLVVGGFFKYTPCSCGGVISSMDFETHLVFNLFFLAVSIMGVYMFNYKNKIAVTQSTETF
jgi:putative oxidoreductase